MGGGGLWVGGSGGSQRLLSLNPTTVTVVLLLGLWLLLGCDKTVKNVKHLVKITFFQTWRLQFYCLHPRLMPGIPMV